MPSANKTQYAILGMLSFGPRSGYDIKKIIDRSLRFFWSENYGHIYPILKRLEKRRWVRRQAAAPTGRRKRNVFALAPAGRAELRAWLAKPVADLPVRNEMVLKLFFGRQMGRRTALSLLAAEEKRNAERLAQLERIEKEISRREAPDLPYWLATLRLGIAVTRTFRGWCRDTAGRFGSLKSGRRA